MFTIESLLRGSGMQIAQPILVAISAIIGLSALLYGYRLVRLFVFLVGFALGVTIAGFFTDTPTALLIGLFAGAICCAWWYLGVFVIGAALGAMVAIVVGFQDTVMVSAVAIIFGLLAIAIRKLMIIISTACFGACLLVGAIAPTLGLRDMAVQSVLSLAVTLIGVTCQYSVTCGKGKEAESSSSSSSSDTEVKNDEVNSDRLQEPKPVNK